MLWFSTLLPSYLNIVRITSPPKPTLPLSISCHIKRSHKKLSFLCLFVIFLYYIWYMQTILSSTETCRIYKCFYLIFAGFLTCRQVLNIMVIFGFMLNYALRVNLTIAIVAMVPTELHTVHDQETGNHTDFLNHTVANALVVVCPPHLQYYSTLIFVCI